MVASIVNVLKGVSWFEVCSVGEFVSRFKVFSFKDGKVKEVNGGIRYGVFVFDGGVELVKVTEKGIKIFFGICPYEENVIDVSFV